MDQQIIDDTMQQLIKIYKEIKFHQGDKHIYLGMNFMKSPANNNLFAFDQGAELVEEMDKKPFHTTVAKLLYIAKRCRPDSSLHLDCSGSVLKYLNNTIDITLTLSGFIRIA